MADPRLPALPTGRQAVSGLDKIDKNNNRDRSRLLKKRIKLLYQGLLLIW